MSRPVEHVAIVGCGFTGTSTLHQLVRQYPVRAITVFESSGLFGPGFAYQPDECPDYLINNTTDTMCLGPDNRRAFLDWLEQRPDIAADRRPHGHLPRALYGRFLIEAFDAALAVAAQRGIRCRLVDATVTRVTELPDGGVQLAWPGGDIHADTAIMATGRCPAIELSLAPPPGTAAQYLGSHIGNAAIDGLDAAADVHVLGASLSAYDVVNRLFAAGTGCRFERDRAGQLQLIAGPNERQVTLYSRSGRLKKIQSPEPQPIRRRALTLPALRALRQRGPLALATVAEAAFADGDRHGAVLDLAAIADPYRGCGDADAVNRRAGELLAADIHAVRSGHNFLVDLAEQAQIDIWDGFAERLIAASEERRYRRDFETAVLSYAAPCPLSTAERLLALHRAGRLKIVRGAGTPVPGASGDGFEIRHAGGVAAARVVVDATGRTDRDVTSARQPDWVRTMVAAGTLHPYRRDGMVMAGADIDLATFRPPGSRRIFFANMLLWGPGFFTSSAFVMATIVSRILRGLFVATKDSRAHASYRSTCRRRAGAGRL